MKKVRISDLAAKTREALHELGLTEHTVWNEYLTTMVVILNWYRERNYEYFDKKIMDEYLLHIEHRFDNHEIGRYYYSSLRRGVTRMTEMYDKGRLEWSCHGHVSKFILNEYYEKLLNTFIESETYHPNTRGDVIWVSRKFFAWLIQNGFHSLKKVDANIIQQFMIFCSKTQRSTGVYNVKLYLKKLCLYLYERKLLPNSFDGLLSFRVSRESKLQAITPPEEIEAVLNIIDRRTPKGRRDYAMILLAVVTGLRAIDISRLKLTDIDWIKGEINVVQSKTGQVLILPLTEDIGTAISDYILHGRQKTIATEIFLRHHVPFQGFADAVAIGDIYDDYRKKVGLERTAFDGKGFHSLRRTAGTDLATANVSVTTVAQMLGHNRITSANKYISLDAKHLKECALGLDGIESEVSA